MRHFMPVLISVILVAGIARGQTASQPPTDKAPAAVPAAKDSASTAATASPPGAPGKLDPAEVEAAAILKELNSLNVYQAPKLSLKKDVGYGHIPAEYEPLRYVKPEKRHFLEQLPYPGSGRAIPEPENLQTVKIGFIGPISPTVSVATGGRSHEEILGNKMLQGCQLAIEEANAKGGYLKRHIPFELVTVNDNGLWGSSGNEIIKLAYEQNVWAILGTIDGANSHIAIRVALKAEIPMMNSGDTDPTFIETNIPWVFRCIGDDRQMNYMLDDYLWRRKDAKPFERVGIIRASNRYGRFGIRKIKDASRRVQHPIIAEMTYKVGTEDFAPQLDYLQRVKVDAVIHWGDAPEGARILNQMRAQGMQQPYFACDRCASDEFVKLAGKNAEGVICTYPWDPTRKDPQLDRLRQAFRQRFPDNGEVETYAAHAYDGMNMLIWTIQQVGLNRAKIRDLLAYRNVPWQGVTGEIEFSPVMDDIGEVYLAKYEQGQWHYLSREELGISRAEIQERSKQDRPAAPGQPPTPTPSPPPAPKESYR